MDHYMIVVVLLRCMVSFFLLFATACICDADRSFWRMLIASILSGIYAYLCMLPIGDFPGNTVVYFVVLIFIGFVAYGKQPVTLFAVCVYSVIHYSVETISLQQNSISKFAILIICMLAGLLIFFYGGKGGLVPVVLKYKEKTISLFALKDTGNRLKDPVTGSSVLVVGADIANQLLGIKKEQLKNPVESVGSIPGLRLIPYSTISQKGKMMLAMRLHEVKVGRRKTSTVVAFAPENIGFDGRYQALTGG